MRKLIVFLALVIPAAAFAASPAQVTLVSSDRSFGAVPEPTFNAPVVILCNGSTGVDVPPGVYEMTTPAEPARLCDGAACTSTTGTSYRADSARWYRFAVTHKTACWTASGAASVQFTRVSF